MRVTVLGCGTSTGVPIPACRCEVCCSSDPKNKRLRSSVFIEPDTQGAPGTGIVIDTSPDFRAQALRAGIQAIDAVFVTHAHADHILGIDDLRAFNYVMGGAIPVYADAATAVHLKRTFYYIFEPDPAYMGAAPPAIQMVEIHPGQPFPLGELSVVPVALPHGSIHSTGYRIGDFAYLTDCHAIPDATHALLKGVKVVILDALRTTPHKTHLTHAQAIRELERIEPERAYLTHLSHDVDYKTASDNLRSLTSLNVELAYDGLQIEL